MKDRTLTAPAIRRVLRFLRTPKGLLLIIFMGLIAIASLKLDASLVIEKVTLASATSALIDVAVTYAVRRRWLLPDGALLTGMIIAFVLTLQESWLVTVNVVAVAILTKHVLRTRWSNIANPAALALVIAAIAFKTGQDWWGALPDFGVIGAVVVFASGVFIAHRINKLTMVLAFFGAYFALLTVATFSDAAAVAETFQTPDLQAALFFGFFMLDDPPTSPVRHEDQVVFGLIVGAVAYFILMQFGGIYFLPAGLLAGNVWESARRLVVSFVRRRRTAEAPASRAWPSLAGRVSSALAPPPGRLRAASGIAVALVAVALVGTAVAMSVRASRVTIADDSSAGALAATPTVQPNAPFPFLESFNADLSGTYSQNSNATESSLTVDATTTGDLRVKLHLELVTAGGAGRNPSTVTNRAQLLDVSSNAILCDGKLTALTRQLIQATCDGTGPYRGVRITFEPTLNADSSSTLSGSLTGTMQRVQ